MNELKLFTDVYMKTEGIPGVLLDISDGTDGRTYATVESRKEYSQEGSDERWPVYFCPIEDVELLNN